MWMGHVILQARTCARPAGRSLAGRHAGESAAWRLIPGQGEAFRPRMLAADLLEAVPRGQSGPVDRRSLIDRTGQYGYQRNRGA